MRVQIIDVIDIKKPNEWFLDLKENDASSKDIKRASKRAAGNFIYEHAKFCVISDIALMISLDLVCFER